MEACFLVSNSFTKTPDQPLHILKYPSPSFPKRSSLHFHSRKVVVQCCHLSSSSPFNGGDDKPSLNADWRSFRAKLVAGEQLRTTYDPYSSSVADSAPISVGDTWAHIIHEPEKGCLLVATEKLDGVHIFERTVILLLSTGPIGPSGIILNRPSLMSIKETRSTVMDEEGMFSDRPLFFGGPLEAGLFLLGPKGEEGMEKSARGVLEEVMKGLYYGTRESMGCAAEMVKRRVVGVGDLGFFDGYCGWEKEQLRDEIRAGYWTVAACSANVVGLESVGSIGFWEEVLGLLGRRKVW